jgi:hypothetical protein
LEYSFDNWSEAGDFVSNTDALITVTQIGFYKGNGCGVESEDERQFGAKKIVNVTVKCF